MPNESSPYPPILILQDQCHYCIPTYPTSFKFPLCYRFSVSSLQRYIPCSSSVLTALCAKQNLSMSWFQQSLQCPVTSSYLSMNPTHPILEHHQPMLFPHNVSNFPNHAQQMVKLPKVMDEGDWSVSCLNILKATPNHPPPPNSNSTQKEPWYPLNRRLSKQHS
jgi:hypothetical protein